MDAKIIQKMMTVHDYDDFFFACKMREDSGFSFSKAAMIEWFLWWLVNDVSLGTRALSREDLGIPTWCRNLKDQIFNIWFDWRKFIAQRTHCFHLSISDHEFIRHTKDKLSHYLPLEDMIDHAGYDLCWIITISSFRLFF